MNARFYPDSPAGTGFQWSAYPKPDVGYMFFGDGDDVFSFDFRDMCGATHLQEPGFGNFHYNFPVEVKSNAGNTKPPHAMDMFPNDSAKLNFEYCYGGGNPNATPFAFEPASAPNQPYFKCAVTYELKLRIPPAYTLTDARYYVEPVRFPSSSSPFGELLTTSGTSDYDYHIDPETINGVVYQTYTFTIPINTQAPAFTLSGHIEGTVVLNKCPDPNLPESHGGLDTFTATVLAYCNGCTNCPDTIAIASASLARHCQGDCSGIQQQNTTFFNAYRQTFGTIPGTTTKVTPGAGIEETHYYPCDQIELVSRGTLVPSPNAAMSFRIAYQPAANPPPFIDFQFFEYVSGTVTCTDTVNSNIYNYTIDATNGLGDLATTFTSGPGNGWDTFNGDFASGTGDLCSRYVNFRPGNNANAAFLNALKNNPNPLTLEAHIFVKVKPVDSVSGGKTFSIGNFPLDVQGQFWGDPTGFNSAGYASCDPYWAFVQVLGVKCESYARIIRKPSDEVCGRRFEFGLNFLGGLRKLPEFENESRPQCFWPAMIDHATAGGGASRT